MNHEDSEDLQEDPEEIQNKKLEPLDPVKEIWTEIEKAYPKTAITNNEKNVEMKWKYYNEKNIVRKGLCCNTYISLIPGVDTHE